MLYFFNTVWNEHSLHLIFELLGYFIGGQIYWCTSKKILQPPPLDRFGLLSVAIFGAFLGSKGLHILEHLNFLWDKPITIWLGGKSVLGGFIGGTIAVEMYKKAIRWTHRTGDAWVFPLLVGLMIGRIGCQLAGVWDQTYGIPTSLPWGWDYGDGLARHPTALYEILLLGGLGIYLLNWRSEKNGLAFNLFLGSYCLFRFGLEFLKPPFGLDANTTPVTQYFYLTAIQWLALFGIVYFSFQYKLIQKFTS